MAGRPRTQNEDADMSVQTAELRLPKRISQLSGRLSRAEWIKLGGMAAVIVGLHVIGWFVLTAIVAPQHLSTGTKTFGIGIGVTAYTLGVRHAFDADHIAAIDNTTRKFMSEGKRPVSVGFWFSLGHSTIVFVLALLLSFGVKTIVGPVQNENSNLHHYTGLIGTSVSGSFLMIIAAFNLVLLIGILKVFRDMRRGRYDEDTLEEHLNNRGLMNRILRPIMKSISRPGQMYPVGVLFGLGFDTATEVALLVLATAGAAGGLPWYAILCLPVLFAAGMCLFDTIDGTFMNFAYGWAFSKPVRKVFYNITITTMSVVVAVFIGGLELLQVLSGQLHLSGGFWNYTNDFDLNQAGFVIVGMFLVIWLAALTIWRIGHIEERWSSGLTTSSVPDR
jgi:high-affinity nickel-transport protein